MVTCTDRHVAAYAAFLRSSDTAKASSTGRRTLAAIKTAHQLAQHDGPLRWQLEARILAGQQDGEIARRCALSAGTVAWYERLFFAVRHCLGARGYIVGQVIGSGLWHGFHDDGVRALWAAFGYFGGPIVLEAIVDVFYKTWQPTEPATIGVYFRQNCPASLEMQAAIAAHSIPINEATNRAFVKAQSATSGEESASAGDEVKRALIRLWQSAHSAKQRSPQTKNTKPEALRGHSAADMVQIVTS